VVALGVLLVVVAAFAWRLSGRVEAATERVDQVQREARAALDAAARDVATAREAAARETRNAMENAERARLVADILAAPDLLRFNLTGLGSYAGATAQVRLSRTRGVMISGSRLAAAPAGTLYHVWLLTRGQPVSALTFSPDENGSSTVATRPPVVPRAVIGAVVTAERSDSAAPSSRVVLVQPPRLDAPGNE
jgi:hypothetical protein